MNQGIRIENITPVLGVDDLEGSRLYYESVLGFTVDWGFAENSHIGSVSRDGKSIMLAVGERIGMTVWVGVDDIPPIYERVKDASSTIVQEPTNQPWAYEFRSADPDGNILWFGSNPLPD